MRSTTSSSSPTPLHNRLATIEASLRLQDATGTSHLQQLEINPEAYGVAKSSRSHIKRLRLQRNRALHGAKPRRGPQAAVFQTTSDVFNTSVNHTAVNHTAEGETQIAKSWDEETTSSTPSSITPRLTCYRRQSAPSYGEKEMLHSVLSAPTETLSREELAFLRAYLAKDHVEEDHKEQ